MTTGRFMLDVANKTLGWLILLCGSIILLLVVSGTIVLVANWMYWLDRWINGRPAC